MFIESWKDADKFDDLAFGNSVYNEVQVKIREVWKIKRLGLFSSSLFPVVSSMNSLVLQNRNGAIHMMHDVHNPSLKYNP